MNDDGEKIALEAARISRLPAEERAAEIARVLAGRAPKRYLIFRGDWYYPSTGWNDYGFFAADLIEAEVALREKYPREYEWAHAVDTTRWEIVERWERTDEGGFNGWKRMGKDG